MKQKVLNYFKKKDFETKYGFKPRKFERYKGRMGGDKPDYYDIPKLDDFSHFIECDLFPSICPMLWEELQIDFNDPNRRFCDHCERYVHKVDNLQNYTRLTESKECVSVSQIFLKTLDKRIDEEYLSNIEYKMKVTKLFLVAKKIGVPLSDELSKLEQLKMVIIKLLEKEDLRRILAIHKIDILFLLEEILPRIEDEQFQKTIKNLLNTKLQKR